MIRICIFIRILNVDLRNWNRANLVQRRKQTVQRGLSVLLCVRLRIYEKFEIIIILRINFIYIYIYIICLINLWIMNLLSFLLTDNLVDPGAEDIGRFFTVRQWVILFKIIWHRSGESS